MPNVRLAADFKGRKAGSIVDLTNEQLVEAYDARAVAKVYREPVPTANATTPGGKRAAEKADKTTDAPASEK